MNNSKWVCLECGKKFATARSAERAANNGCPKCGGVDIDLDVVLSRPERSKDASIDVDSLFRLVKVA